MNILFLSKDYPPKQIGGVGTYIYEMAHLLTGAGHKAFVITEAIEQPMDYVDKGVYVFRVQPKRNRLFDAVRASLGGFLERMEYSYAVSRKIKQVASKHKIDIIESCEARAEGFWYYFLNKKPPLVIKLHTPEGIVYKLNRNRQTKDRLLIEKLEEWWIRRADRIIGLSEAIVGLTQRHYHLKFKNPPIVVNPVNINFFKPAAHSDDNKNILYSGRLEFRKGVHILARAIPRVLEKFPEAKFIFIGDDCGMKLHLLEEISRLKAQASVEFIDQVPQDKLVDYYQQSAVCVVPSLWENHPYAVLEAMACGKAVIASGVGGIPEIIKDKYSGILVLPGSFISLAEAIIGVLGDNGLQRMLGDNARKYIEDKYASSAVVQENLKVYKELLA